MDTPANILTNKRSLDSLEEEIYLKNQKQKLAEFEFRFPKNAKATVQERIYFYRNEATGEEGWVDVEHFDTTKFT